MRAISWHASSVVRHYHAAELVMCTVVLIPLTGGPSLSAVDMTQGAGTAVINPDSGLALSASSFGAVQQQQQQVHPTTAHHSSVNSKCTCT